MAAKDGKALISEEKDDKVLISAGCKAFGIDEKHVFSARVYGDEVAILTMGGTRVHYRMGDEVQPLTEIQVTGVNPAKRKPITGEKRKK